MPFADRLRHLRKEHGWTQDKLAEKLGVHGRQIGKYELGIVLPGAETLIKIAKTLNVSIDYLLLDEQTNSVNEISDPELLRLFGAIDQMNGEDRKIVKSLIDAYVKKHQMEGILKNQHSEQ
ncbi:MAG: helix-turn-helix transcriptional regulator [Bacillota bacterium]|jgi:transcriptional regulator with XRE-family HTH domain